jgi:hypothetical protein
VTHRRWIVSTTPNGDVYVSEDLGGRIIAEMRGEGYEQRVLDAEEIITAREAFVQAIKTTFTTPTFHKEPQA